MGIRDLYKRFSIQDGTTGIITNTIDNNLFTDYGEQEFKISIGDFLLLQNIKSILNENHDAFIKLGYKEH